MFFGTTRFETAEPVRAPSRDELLVGVTGGRRAASIMTKKGSVTQVDYSLARGQASYSKVVKDGKQ